MSVMSCDGVRRLLSPYLDGELVGEDQEAFEDHAGSCAPCRRALADEEAVVDALRQAVPRTRAPEALRRRVDGLLVAPARSWRGWKVAAAAALLGTSLAAYQFMPPVRSSVAPAAADLAALAADTHLRYTRGQLPLEVGSDKPDVVSRWFAGRVPFSLTLPEHPIGSDERRPYTLLGGRLVSFRDDYAAYVAYRVDDRPISLLVTSARLAQPSGGETVPFGRLVFHHQSVNGLKTVTWTDNGLTYSMAFDLSVTGTQSCGVCHGSPEERHRIEGFLPAPRT